MKEWARNDSPPSPHIEKSQDLLGFCAEMLVENRVILHLFGKMGFGIKKRREEGVYELEMMFR